MFDDVKPHPDVADPIQTRSGSEEELPAVSEDVVPVDRVDQKFIIKQEIV